MPGEATVEARLRQADSLVRQAMEVAQHDPAAAKRPLGDADRAVSLAQSASLHSNDIYLIEEASYARAKLDAIRKGGLPPPRPRGLATWWRDTTKAFPSLREGG